jgi:hypothetical protein
MVSRAIASLDVWLAEAERIPEKEKPAPPDDVDHQRGDYLISRLRAALLDLGLALPADWITRTGDGLVFGDLTYKQADALAIGLEDLAAARSSAAPIPGLGQQPSFGRTLR